MARYDSKPSLESTLARLHIIDLLESLGPSRMGTIIVVVPATTDADEWFGPALLHLRELREGKDLQDVCVEDIPEYADHGTKALSLDVALLTRDGLNAGHTGARCMLLLTEAGHEDLKHPSIRLADDLIYLHFNPVLVIEAAARMGRQISLDDASMLAEMPRQHRKLALSSARPIAESFELHRLVLEMEAEQERKKVKSSARNVPDVIPLEDLHGFGDAKLWGLELAKDIEDWNRGNIRWQDVDNGILLSGPPGCGKTTFASALAKTLNAHFVSGSYSTWLGTGDGHQGDLLKSMQNRMRRQFC
jgi:cell division protease FtsH